MGFQRSLLFSLLFFAELVLRLGRIASSKALLSIGTTDDDHDILKFFFPFVNAFGLLNFFSWRGCGETLISVEAWGMVPSARIMN